MSGNPKRTELALHLAYPVVWVLSVAFFWTLTSGADAMGYALVFIYALNPAAILIASFLIGLKEIGRKGSRNKLAWMAPVLFGVLYMLLPYSTFTLANTLTTGNIHAPALEMAALGAALSAASLELGFLISRKKEKRAR